MASRGSRRGRGRADGDGDGARARPPVPRTADGDGFLLRPDPAGKQDRATPSHGTMHYPHLALDLVANGWAEAVVVSRTEGPLRAPQAREVTPAQLCRAGVRFHAQALRACLRPAGSLQSSLRELHPGPPLCRERRTTGPAWKLRGASLRSAPRTPRCRCCAAAPRSGPSVRLTASCAARRGASRMWVMHRRGRRGHNGNDGTARLAPAHQQAGSQAVLTGSTPPNQKEHSLHGRSNLRRSHPRA